MPESGHERLGASHADLALLAHEIRGALTIVNGYAELLRRDLDEAARLTALDRVSHAVDRIDQMLASALEGSFGAESPSEPVDLVELAEDVAADQREVSGRRIEVRAEARPVVFGMSEALERALGNLIGNALKYSLSSSTVEITVAEEDARAVLAVADRGPGIPEDERERVLEPFARLDIHRSVPGTGLGLTVVSSVARQHGGELQILDRPGGGAVVRIELPLPAASEGPS